MNGHPPESLRRLIGRMLFSMSTVTTLALLLEWLTIHSLSTASRAALILLVCIHWGCFTMHRLYLLSSAVSIHISSGLCLLLLVIMGVTNPFSFSDAWVSFAVYPIIVSLFLEERTFFLWSAVGFVCYAVLEWWYFPVSPAVANGGLEIISRVVVGAGGFLLGWVALRHFRDRNEEWQRNADERVRDRLERFMGVLVPLVERKTRISRDEIRQVAELVRNVLRRFPGIPVEDWEIQWLSVLHYVSRISLPEYLYEKEGHLTIYEYRTLDEHCKLAHEVLGDEPMFRRMVEIMRYHHERWNGTGYPYGRKGPEIPRLAQIFGVVESYVAMTSERSYRRAMTPLEALRELKQTKDQAFDPEVVAALEAVLLQQDPALELSRTTDLVAALHGAYRP